MGTELIPLITLHTSHLDEEAVVFLIFTFPWPQVLPLVAWAGLTAFGFSDETLTGSVHLASFLAIGQTHGGRVGLF